jgi:hypothetical protein
MGQEAVEKANKRSARLTRLKSGVLLLCVAGGVIIFGSFQPLLPALVEQQTRAFTGALSSDAPTATTIETWGYRKQMPRNVYNEI